MILTAELVRQIIETGAQIAALVFPIVALFKLWAKSEGWYTRFAAAVFAALAAYGFCSWATKTDAVANVFAVMFALAICHGVNIGATAAKVALNNSGK